MTFIFIISVLILIFVIFLIIKMLLNKLILTISVRNMFRRITDTVLIILGSLFGTALITGSFAINDSFQKYLFSQVTYSLGEVDEIVQVDEERGNVKYFTFDEVKYFIDRLESEKLIDGYLPVLNSNISVGLPGNARSLDGGLSKNVEFVGSDLSLFNKFGNEDRDDIDTDGVYINQSLADSLNLSVGDKIELLVDPVQRTLFWVELPQLEITGILGNNALPNMGEFRGFNSSFLLVPDDVYRKIVGLKVENSFSGIVLSNTGDELKGNDLSEEVKSTFLDWNTGNKFKIDMLKYDAYASIDASEYTGIFFMALSSFSIIAGILLLINVYTMLGEERRQELGTLRALGFTRNKITYEIMFEGFFYSLISSFIGVFVGFGISKVILNSVVDLYYNISSNIPFGNFIFANLPNIEFAFFIKPQSVFYGFVIGLSIPLIVIFFTGRKIAGMNIVFALRGISEKIGNKKRKMIKFFIFFMVVFGVISLVNGLQNNNPAVFYLGIMLIGFLFPLLTPEKMMKHLITIFSILLIIFTLFTDSITFFSQTEISQLFIVLKGLTILVSGGIIVIFNLKFIEMILQKIFGKVKNAGPILKVAISFPARNTGRTSLAIAMYAIVFFIITILSIIPASQKLVIEKNKEFFFNGFDGGIFFLVSDEVENLNGKLENYRGVSEITPLNYTNIVTYSPKGVKKSTVFFIDAPFEEGNKLNVIYDKNLGISSDKEIWNYLEENKNTCIVSKNSFPNIRLGQSLTIYELKDDLSIIDIFSAGNINYETVDQKKIGKNLTLKVIGYIEKEEFSMINGIYISKNSIEEDFGKDFSKVHILFDYGDMDVEERGNLISYLNEDSQNSVYLSDDIADLTSSFFKGTISILNSFLYFGLFVGIIGISIIMFKALYERTRLIGMLKAIGFTKKMVFYSFFLETTFIVFLGIMIGIITGSLTAYDFFLSFSDQMKEFAIPWVEIILIGLISYIISIISTSIPGYLASKINPAKAIKYFE